MVEKVELFKSCVTVLTLHTKCSIFHCWVFFGLNQL